MGSVAQWLANLLLELTVLGSIPSITENFGRKNIIHVACVNLWRFFEESGQWLENVDPTHQALACGNPALQKVVTLVTLTRWCHWTSVMPVTLVVLWVSYVGIKDSWEQGKCPISKLWALMPTTYHVMPWWTQWRFCFESHNRLQRQNYFDGNVMKLFWYLGIHNFVRIMLKAKCQNLIGEQSFDSILRIF